MRDLFLSFEVLYELTDLHAEIYALYAVHALIRIRFLKMCSELMAALF